MSVKHGANLFEIAREYNFKKEEILDFSSNINPLGASLKAKEALIKNIDMISIYPDPDYINLKNSISSYCSVKSENILLGSGATQFISSFIKLISPKKSLIVSPAYSEYERELKKVHSNIDKYFLRSEDDFKVDLDHFLQTIKQNNYELVVICNPNNPTGHAFTKDELEVILNWTNSFVMVDETYIEFTDTNIYSCSSLVDIYPNLFLIRGTSKFFSTPGIRLGYALTSNETIYNDLKQNLDLWNINIFASIIGEAMLSDTEYICKVKEFMKTEREYLMSNLSKINSLKIYDSKGNFILCQISSKVITARDLYNILVKDKIVIRDASSFEGLDEYFFRVCILNHKDNELLIKKLRGIFSS
ncbi:threonine-phosphate decarboxylase [Alkalithermobacter thermoalcaliphilus JW-YL-7 = DSM 7308]|uniref:Aminotransferase class I and II n=1 Tax=Alkalithermobacter thermoalcaliphilus JW-YL-7 = DSM 7308 TaxID=1121328 RepID=A0A150FPG1_CLOPD|nr:aminotransferase class I and II [[Clostridium] paradoxum JW-YL-7 = DSM 7308]SHL25685.1 threonine-phosphate decarboxylase [[Clostridium] paradoxum JW-YL-7 = DSM 7308]